MSDETHTTITGKTQETAKQGRAGSMVKRKIKLDRVRESSKESRVVQKAGRPGGMQGRKVMIERHKSEGGKNGKQDRGAEVSLKIPG